MGNGAYVRQYTGFIHHVDDKGIKESYNGMLVSNRPHGYGTYRNYTGEWHNGTFVKGTIYDVSYLVFKQATFTCNKWICVLPVVETFKFVREQKEYEYTINVGSYVPNGETTVKLKEIDPFVLEFDGCKIVSGTYTLESPVGLAHFKILEDGSFSPTITIYSNDRWKHKIYEGEHELFTINGNGTYYHPNGVPSYKGTFLNGFMHGRGITFDINGNKTYDGQFVKGKMRGAGMIFFGAKSCLMLFDNDMPIHRITDLVPVPSRTLSTITTCSICMERAVAVLFLPCKHCLLCKECSDSIRDVCIACRSVISEKISIYI